MNVNTNTNVFPVPPFMKFKTLIPGLIATTTAGLLAPIAAVLAQNSFGDETSQCQATLIGNEPNSRITLRSGPGSNYQSLGYGLVGDHVQILTRIAPEIDTRKDSQGNLWYRVGFPSSGAKGWIREDFLRLQCTRIND